MADETSCQAPRVQESLDAVLGALVGIVDNIQSVEAYTKQLASHMEQIKQVITHYHDSHLHPIAHDGHEIYNVPVGRAIMPMPITPADKIMSEYNTGYDSDGNGLIYGRDFIFIKSDSLPKMISPINDMLIDQNKIRRRLTYNEYLDTIPNADKVWTR